MCWTVTGAFLYQIDTSFDADIRCVQLEHGDMQAWHLQSILVDAGTAPFAHIMNVDHKKRAE